MAPNGEMRGGALQDTTNITGDFVGATQAWLASRPGRAPDYAGENRALLALADAMAERPGTVLDLLCELILEICDADSAGVSLLREEEDEFYWPAVAGAWAPYIGGTMPRSASPCGEVLKYDQVLIFQDVVAQFPAAAQASPEIAELMLAPFHLDGAPIGTVWAITHDPAHQFDSEDRRLLTSLARFAAAAYQSTRAHDQASMAEQRLSLANRELGHRLKNNLSLVMAIVGQTLKYAHDQDSINVLQQRLQSLGAAHNVLIAQASDVAPIEAVARNVLAGIGQLERVEFDGPEITLGPRTTVTLALILHELGTNAIKYGALSAEGGRVRLSWGVEQAGEDRAVAVRWLESGGPAVGEPTSKGFGSRLIEMGLLGNGGAKLDYAPDGLRAEFSAPHETARTF